VARADARGGEPPGAQAVERKRGRGRCKANLWGAGDSEFRGKFANLPIRGTSRIGSGAKEAAN
jgi:hypothetical protein